ncbi:hypothetical protein DUI87_33492 [Hirundo rustica rustica]|uniref:Uncharacterized protein n=1 Tax=Hirundo rustica rustica TaxID=333673 RepID=A0A3M0IN60_HIRRU|nr:hypothetical protein DUI87_33492 [Hirundo rustica rustica]
MPKEIRSNTEISKASELWNSNVAIPNVSEQSSGKAGEAPVPVEVFETTTSGESQTTSSWFWCFAISRQTDPEEVWIKPRDGIPGWDGIPREAVPGSLEVSKAGLERAGMVGGVGARGMR